MFFYFDLEVKKFWKSFLNKRGTTFSATHFDIRHGEHDQNKGEYAHDCCKNPHFFRFGPTEKTNHSA